MSTSLRMVSGLLGRGARQAAREILEDRVEGLRMVLGTLAATNMTDAGVQVALIGVLVERISTRTRFPARPWAP